MGSNILLQMISTGRLGQTVTQSIIKQCRAICTSSSKHQDFSSTEPVVDGQTNSPVVSRPELPLITSRKLEYPPVYRKPRQVWVENLDTIEEEKLGLVDLHPDVFGYAPRVDVLHSNVRWQRLYRFVSYANTKVRSEVRGGGRKPRPQKGQGMSRHGSIRSPIWKGGGVVHGPRSPTSYFYMLDFYTRVNGLRAALSVKLAQDDLHIVDSLEIPTDDPKYLSNLVEERMWGPAVLFVDDTDIMPRNLTAATDNVGHFNLMPVYGLNVYSMLKHHTLVLSLAAAERIEERILFHLHRSDSSEVVSKFKLSQN